MEMKLQFAVKELIRRRSASFSKALSSCLPFKRFEREATRRGEDLESEILCLSNEAKIKMKYGSESTL